MVGEGGSSGSTAGGPGGQPGHRRRRLPDGQRSPRASSAGFAFGDLDDHEVEAVREQDKTWESESGSAERFRNNLKLADDAGLDVANATEVGRVIEGRLPWWDYLVRLRDERLFPRRMAVVSASSP